MNSTQIGITAATVFVVSTASALLFSVLTKSRKPSAQYSKEPQRFPTDEYIYNLNPSYETKYNADRDPTMPEYDPFERTKYRGGTRCLECNSLRYRYTRRK